MAAFPRVREAWAVLLAVTSASAACDVIWPYRPWPTDQGVEVALPRDQTIERWVRDLVDDQPSRVGDAAAKECVIAGQRYAQDSKDPTDSSHCRLCDPTITETAWSPAEGCVITLAGTGTKASVDGPLASANASASLNQPHGMVVDEQGTIYFAEEGGHCIRRIIGGEVRAYAGTCGTPGHLDGSLGSAQFNAPHGLARGADRVIYVADEQNHRIRQITDDQVITLAGDGTAGFVNAAASSARFNTPRGLAISADGAILVADTLNHCIRKIAGGQVSTLAGLCTAAGFAEGSVGDARFNTPAGLTVDADGVVYVADSLNHRIRKIAGGQVSTLVGSSKGFVDGSVTSAQFNTPYEVKREASGALLIAEVYNHAIRRLREGWVATVAGTGTRGAADGPRLSATFYGPDVIAIWKDVAYISDEQNSRIRALRLPPQ